MNHLEKILILKLKIDFEYWKSVEFSLGQWKKIKKYTEKRD